MIPPRSVAQSLQERRLRQREWWARATARQRIELGLDRAESADDGNAQLATIKGKGSPEAFEIIAQDESISNAWPYVEAMQWQLDQATRAQSMKESNGDPGPSTMAARLSRAVLSAKAAQEASSSTALSDRFDWRLTAQSFRRLHLQDLDATSAGAKRPNRRPPSVAALASVDARSQALKKQVKEYQDRLSYLVGLERKHEQEGWERLRSRDLEDLVAEGWAMDGMVGYWSGGGSSANKSANRKKPAPPPRARTAVLTRQGMEKLGWSRFKVGDKVELRPSQVTNQVVEDFLPREEVVMSALPAKNKAKGRASKKAADAESDVLDATSPPSPPPVKLTATVLSSDTYRLRLYFQAPHSLVDLEACTSWRLDLAPNDAIDAKVDEAIVSLGVDTHNLDLRDSEGKWELKGTELVPSLLPMAAPTEEGVDSSIDLQTSQPSSIFADDVRIRSWYERYLRSSPLILDSDPDLGLNASQLKAVATMLSSRLSLIQGPPGTGKTHTLVSTLKLLKHHFAVPHPILLSAHTNVAVDNLVEAALHAGLEVVRVGPSNGVVNGGEAATGKGKAGDVAAAKESRVEECTLERKMEKHPLYKKLEEVRIKQSEVRKRIAKLYDEEHGKRQAGSSAFTNEKLATSDGKNDEEVPTSSAAPSKPPPTANQQLAALLRSVGRYSQQINMLSRKIHTSILYSADVVCSTLLSSTSASLRSIDFPLVFIDESTQALEVLSLLPMMKGARQVGLIGDHRQLPPVLRDSEARKEGGAKSLFERLLEEDGWGQGKAESELELETPAHRRTRMQMLQVQHRMHPQLAAFPNDEFYGGRLDSADGTEEIASLKTSLPLNQKDATIRLAFIDHDGRESVSRSFSSGASDVSLLNHTEAELLCHVLADVLVHNRDTLCGADIGVVTPYLAQCRLVSSLLRPASDDEVSRPIRRALEQKLARAGVNVAELEKIEVKTVDGFQGREKEVIVFSAVRCQGSAAVKSEMESSSDGEYGFAAADIDDFAVPYTSNNNLVQNVTTAANKTRTYNVGFLSDERRLNVALTRAKRGLFVVGNLETWARAKASASGSASGNGNGNGNGHDGGAAADVDTASASASTMTTSTTSSTALSNFVEHVRRRELVLRGEDVRKAVDLQY